MKKLPIALGIIALIVTGSFFVNQNLLKGSMRSSNNDSRSNASRSDDSTATTRFEIPTHSDEPELLPYPLKLSDFDFIANKYGRDVFSRPLPASRQVDDGTPTPTLPPRVYKVAFVNVQWGKNSLYKNFSADQVQQIDEIRLGLPAIFNEATYGLATLDTSYPVVNLPTELSSSIFDSILDSSAFRTSQFLPEFYLKNPDDFDFIYFYISSYKSRSSYNWMKADYSGGFFPDGKGEALPSCFNLSKEYNNTSSKLKGTITMRRKYDDFPEIDFETTSYNSYLSSLIGMNFLNAINPTNSSEQITALHEIEHAWSLYPAVWISYFDKYLSTYSQQEKELLIKMISVNPDFHFGKMVENQESADPHDAVQFELTPDNRAKICLNQLPPFKPYRFSNTVLYFMGFGYKLDYNKQYKFLKTYFPDEYGKSPSIINIDDYKDGCFYYKFVYSDSSFKPIFDTYTLNDIKTLYPDIHQCK